MNKDDLVIVVNGFGCGIDWNKNIINDSNEIVCVRLSVCVFNIHIKWKQEIDEAFAMIRVISKNYSRTSRMLTMRPNEKVKSHRTNGKIRKRQG